VQAKILRMNFYSLILILLFISCSNNSDSIKLPDTKGQSQRSEQELFKSNYSIPDIKNYTNSSRYAALFIIKKRYNNQIIIEIEEFHKGMTLCVKQPLFLTPGGNFDSTIRLPFDQICYWLEENEANKIKELYKKYDSDKEISNISCTGCLDPEIWTLEIYNYGRYSSITQDAYGQYEPFIDSLFAKVNLTEKNGYRIKGLQLTR
jgi:hypothetical protein